ncbi:MAG: endonuclease/exonuclease/phosphatase family protein, partial [Spirochaetota bacterium]
DGDTIRLLTFNIAHGRGLSVYQGLHSHGNIVRKLDRISNLINNSEADIIALQEADVSSHWNRHINLVEHIRKGCSLEHAEAGVHNIRGGKKPLEYGNAILSRFPIHRCITLPFGDREMGEKGCMLTALNAGGTEITLVNLHLDYKSRIKRIEQAEMIIERIESRKGQIPFPVICGDFNTSSSREADAVQHLFSFMNRHDRYELFPEKAPTFPSHFPVRGLDFIMLPSQYTCIECTVIKSYLSDHRPVLMEFRIN